MLPTDEDYTRIMLVTGTRTTELNPARVINGLASAPATRHRRREHALNSRRIGDSDKTSRDTAGPRCLISGIGAIERTERDGHG